MQRQTDGTQTADEHAVLNLGCGRDQHPDAHNVDASGACAPDETYDLTEYPWPPRWHGAEEIRMYHVLEHLPDMHRALEEAATVLEPGGRLELRLPMGVDAIADSTHIWGERRQPWTWRTPEFAVGKEHWQPDVELRVADRDVELWSVHPIDAVRIAQTWWWQRLLEHRGPGAWCFDVTPMSGEFTIVYEK